MYWGVSSSHTGLKIYLLLGPPVRPKVKGEEAERSVSSFLRKDAFLVVKRAQYQCNTDKE